MHSRPRLPHLLLLLLLSAAALPLSAQTRAESTAKRLYDSRTSASDAATRLQSTFRADDREVVRLLHFGGYRSTAIAGASIRTLRASPRETASYMSSAGMETREIASGLSRGARITGRRALDVLASARLSGVMTRDVYRAVSATPGDVTSFLRSRGESSERAARDLVATHRLGSDAVTKELMAEYEVVEVGRALKNHFGMDASRIRERLEGEGVDAPLAEAALLELGFEPEVPAPTAEYYFIRDYRINTSPGALIESPNRIVSRPAVLPAPHDTDGVIWIQGLNLDRPETEVWGGTEAGTPVQGVIRNREKIGFQDRLEVYFPHFRGRGLRLETDGGALATGTMHGIAYAPIEVSLFEEALDGLFLSVIGGGFQAQFGNAVINGSFEQPRENGMEVVIARLVNDGFSVSTEEADQGVNVVLSISFDEEGREFSGKFFGYIPCWECRGTTIPRADCPTLTLDCMAEHLGALFESLGECMNPEVWEEREILDTSGVPFQGDLSNAALDIRMNLGANGNGLWYGPTTFDFQADVSLSTLGLNINESEIDAYVSQRVTEALNAALQESLSVHLIQGLRTYAGILGWGAFQNLQRMPDGRLFAVFIPEF